MVATQSKPVNQDREFKISELFFSTTNTKGDIRYGNEVFTRIAGYELDELRGKPHNIIRHPDMPRSAFKLVWDYLNHDKVVAAYVKNMAKDGRYYWVIALIMPCDEGYLSIRLKPSSSFFPHVQKAYRDVLEVESRAEAMGKSSKDVMLAGTNRLIEILAGLGFSSYDEFMWAALTAEMTSRELKRSRGEFETVVTKQSEPGQQEGRDQLAALYQNCTKFDGQLGILFSKLDAFSKFRDEVAPKADAILRLGEAIRLITLNAEIQSSKLGDSGAALSAVASKLGEHSKAGTDTIALLNKQISELTPIISDLVFNTIVSKLKIEMATSFLDEILGGLDGSEIGTACAPELFVNVTILIKSFLDTGSGIVEVMNNLQSSLAAVDKEAGVMGKFISTLNVINLIGKIETARSDTTQAFTAIFDRVQQETYQAESELLEFLRLIGENTVQLVSMDELDVREFVGLRSALDRISLA